MEDGSTNARLHLSFPLLLLLCPKVRVRHSLKDIIGELGVALEANYSLGGGFILVGAIFLSTANVAEVRNMNISLATADRYFSFVEFHLLLLLGVLYCRYSLLLDEGSLCLEGLLSSDLFFLSLLGDLSMSLRGYYIAASTIVAKVLGVRLLVLEEAKETLREEESTTLQVARGEHKFRYKVVFRYLGHPKFFDLRLEETPIPAGIA